MARDEDDEPICYFVGMTTNPQDVFDLFDENWADFDPPEPESDDEQDEDELDEDFGPNCKMAELFGFEWYDHDRIDLECIDRPVAAEMFPDVVLAAGEDPERFQYWDLDLFRRALAVAVENGMAEINCAVKLEEDFSDDPMTLGQVIQCTPETKMMFVGPFAGEFDEV